MNTVYTEVGILLRNSGRSSFGFYSKIYTGHVVGHTRKKETNTIDTSRRINLFPNAEDSNSVLSEFCVQMQCYTVTV